MAVAEANFNPVPCAVDDGFPLQFTLSHAALSTTPTTAATFRPWWPLPPSVWLGLKNRAFCRGKSFISDKNRRRDGVIGASLEPKRLQVATPLTALSRELVGCLAIFAVPDLLTHNCLDLNLITILQNISYREFRLYSCKTMIIINIQPSRPTCTIYVFWAGRYSMKHANFPHS